MKYIIAYLALLGILSLLWTILPGWIIGIIATFGIFLLPGIVTLMEDDRPSYSVPQNTNTETWVEDRDMAFQEASDEQVYVKPTIDANDHIERFRHFANKSLYDIDDELTLVDIRARNSSIETGFDRIIIETSIENIMFPFVNGFDQSLMDVDNIAHCVFKIILVNDECSNYQEEYICFGHPNDFLNI